MFVNFKYLAENHSPYKPLDNKQCHYLNILEKKRKKKKNE